MHKLLRGQDDTLLCSAPTADPTDLGAEVGVSSEQGGRQGAKRNLDCGSGVWGHLGVFSTTGRQTAGPSSVKIGCKAEIPQSLNFPSFGAELPGLLLSQESVPPTILHRPGGGRARHGGLPPAPPHLQLLFQGSPGLDLFILQPWGSRRAGLGSRLTGRQGRAGWAQEGSGRRGA